MPLFLVAVFLLVTLGVGIYFSLSKKITTLREYAIGNKRFATTTLVATVLATNFGGGGLIRTVQQVHSTGLYWITLFLVATFGLYAVSWLALRMGPFMQHLSMAETIGSIYGRYARCIAALSGTVTLIVYLTGQINVMSLAIRMCVDSIDPQLVTIAATLIVIAYSMFGGIRSVTITDLLQFITFAVIIPILAYYVMLRTADKPAGAMLAFLQSQEKFQFSKLFHFDTKLVGLVALCLSDIVCNIEPQNVQRVYMSAEPMQGRRVFLYSTLFGFIIKVIIILVGLFVFVGAPDLPVTGVWDYIMAHIPPIFKGMISISLLAMTMSTADSILNAAVVMITHDMLESIRGVQAISYANQLRLARWTTLIIGLAGMVLAFYCQDLLKLMYWTLDLSIPITTAPFILAVFGFRGNARTALIGMATGVIAILMWNRWIEPSTKIDGSFVCMLANGLAMMVAHYLFKQPEGVGWVGPDHTLIQIRQAYMRKKRARKEAIKNGLLHMKDTCAKLKPSHPMLICMGCYIIISNLLIYFISSIAHHGDWFIAQLLVGACFLGYSTFVSEKKQPIPDWILGLFWAIGVSFCLPINVLWHWWHGTHLFLNLGLSLTHLAVTLLVLPLYLGIGFLIVSLSMAIYLSSMYYASVLVLSPPEVVLLLLLYLAFGLLIFGIFIYFKRKINSYFNQITYLKSREQIRTSQSLKASLYDAAMVASTPATLPKKYGSILGKVVAKIEESISFLDSNIPLYKEDFQSIINKFYDWIAYFNKKEHAKRHALLQANTITLDKLVHKVEYALSQEVTHPPRLFVEQINEPGGAPSAQIVCDINQVIYLLVQTILRITSNVDGSSLPVVSIQLHNTSLQFKQADPIDSSHAVFITFQATAFVVSKAITDPQLISKVKTCYDDTIGNRSDPSKEAISPSIDLQQEMMSSIVTAHYGYLETPIDASPKAIVLVLPSDVTAIRDKMAVKLPIGYLTSETPLTPKEQADSLMALMQFHDYICKSSHQDDPIDIKTISGLLLLLRQNFGCKRHASGQLFCVRAVGIAQLVVKWVFHSPKVIYASLLYELVRHTCLPLSYVKKHYNLGVYAFVLNVLGIDKRQELNHPSLLYVQNRLKQAIQEDHVQLSVLFIKLAERLYDLRHAGGYIHLEEITHMAQETLAIDVQIATRYLGSEIAAELEKVANQALKISRPSTQKGKNNL